MKVWKKLKGMRHRGIRWASGGRGEWKRSIKEGRDKHIGQF